MEENVLQTMTDKKCRVKFVVTTPHAVRKLYLCGSTKNLGNWNPTNAKELHKKDGIFELCKFFRVGETISFKILEKMTWDRVELGYWCEDVANHTVVAEKGLVVNIEIPNFKYEE